jgi:hypothetical protein
MLFDIVALLALAFAIMIVLADKWADDDKKNH